jgi:ribosome-associated protein
MKAAGSLRRSAAGIDGESGWVLLDFDSVVVHLFDAETRRFYALESLWSDLPRIPFEPGETVQRSAASGFHTRRAPDPMRGL